MDVELAPLDERAALIDEWAALEPHCDPSCFIASPWIATWLESLPASQRLWAVRARAGDTLVALGVYGASRRRVAGRWRSALLLHATGDPRLDVIRIEGNALLARRGIEADCAAAVWRALVDDDVAWGAVGLPGVAASDPMLAAAVADRWVVESARLDAPYVDFAALRERYTCYRDALDKKARYTLRTAEKTYEQAFGSLRVEVPSTEAQALERLAELALLSQRRWRRAGEASAFDSEYFRTFHERLLSAAWRSGYARLFSVLAGETLIGHVYAFEQRGWISFYQCGYDYELLGADAQPGYATLGTLLEYCFRSGARAFDFLGDAVHYKRVLSTHRREFVWAEALRPSLAARAEYGGRRLWRAARGRLRLPRQARAGHVGGKPSSSR